MEGMGLKEFYRGRRVFVTGITGFKGSWLALWLKELGAEITGYALSPPTDPSLFELARIGGSIHLVTADVRDSDRLTNELVHARPEIVIHMAAQPLVRDSYKIPVDTYSINVMGTVNLLEAVRRCPEVRAVINVTSDKCYENREWAWGYREEDALGGYDPYSSSKACSELVTAAYRNSYFNPQDYQRHGVALASARSGNVIGGGDWGADRLIPDCIRALLDSEKIVIRNPTAIRPWQHVLEPLYGYLLLAKKLCTEGCKFAEAWNFGPAEENLRTVEWIVKKICAAWGKEALYTVDGGKHLHETNCLKLDCSKAGTELGWLPRLNLEQTIRAIVEWTICYIDGGDVRECCFAQIDDYSEKMMDASSDGANILKQSGFLDGAGASARKDVRNDL